MKRTNEEKEKKMRDDCMIRVMVHLRERKKGQEKKERWGETDAKLTSLNISYQ
jgi:hypothetical protein